MQFKMQTIFRQDAKQDVKIIFKYISKYKQLKLYKYFKNLISKNKTQVYFKNEFQDAKITVKNAIRDAKITMFDTSWHNYLYH